MKIIVGILEAISMLVVMWHVFAPRDMWIEGFYGYPLIVCCLIVGYGLCVGMEEIREKE